jgi:hypothetical protein
MFSSLHVSRSARSAVSALLTALYLASCHSWQVGTPTPAQFVEREHPAQVRVTRTDSSTVTLQSPTVRGDSLVGLLAGTPGGDSARQAGVPLGDVASVASRQGSTGKTILLTTGIVVGVLAVLTILSALAIGEALSAGN